MSEDRCCYPGWLCADCAHFVKHVVVPPVCVCPDRDEISYVSADREACEMFELKEVRDEA
jgi:hypothetical protein